MGWTKHGWSVERQQSRGQRSLASSSGGSLVREGGASRMRTKGGREKGQASRRWGSSYLTRLTDGQQEKARQPPVRPRWEREARETLNTLLPSTSTRTPDYDASTARPRNPHMGKHGWALAVFDRQGRSTSTGERIRRRREGEKAGSESGSPLDRASGQGEAGVWKDNAGKTWCRRANHLRLQHTS